MRKIVLAAALCFCASASFAAAPPDASSGLKPSAADLTGPQRGMHAIATPDANSAASAPAQTQKHKARHKKLPPADAPK